MCTNLRTEPFYLPENKCTQILNLSNAALDIHFFSKLSAGQRAGYKSIGGDTNIVSEYAMKHSTTIWVTIRKVVARRTESLENLKEYF